LWACPFARADKVELLISEYGLRKYIAFLLVEKSDIETHLLELFK